MRSIGCGRRGVDGRRLRVDRWRRECRVGRRRIVWLLGLSQHNQEDQSNPEAQHDEADQQQVPADRREEWHAEVHGGVGRDPRLAVGTHHDGTRVLARKIVGRQCDLARAVDEHAARPELHGRWCRHQLAFAWYQHKLDVDAIRQSLLRIGRLILAVGLRARRLEARRRGVAQVTIDFCGGGDAEKQRAIPSGGSNAQDQGRSSDLRRQVGRLDAECRQDNRHGAGWCREALEGDLDAGAITDPRDQTDSTQEEWEPGQRDQDTDELIEALSRIVQAEQINADDDALRLIARHASGSFRDAISSLDQLSSAGNGSIDTQSVQAILGVVDDEVLTQLIDAINAGDARQALTMLDDLVEGGQDLTRLIRDLIDRLRLVLLTLELGAPPRSAMLGSGLEGAVARAAGVMTEAAAITLIDGLLATEHSLRSGGDARLALEILLIKAARPASDRSLDGALRRIEALEGGAPTLEGGAPARAVPAPLVAAPIDEPTPPAPVVEPPSTPNVEEAPPWDEPPVDRVPIESAPEPSIEITPLAALPPEPLPVAITPVEPLASEPPPSAAPREPIGDLTLGADELRDIWETTIGRLTPKLRSILQTARPLRIERGALVIGFPSEAQFQKNQADREQNRAEIAVAASNALGADVRIVLETLPEPGTPPPVIIATPHIDPTDVTDEEVDPATREEEFVRNLVETLDASEEEMT